MNEFSWQPGTGVSPIAGWEQRFWGPNYERLLKIQREVDPERRMFTPIYSVGWEAPQ